MKLTKLFRKTPLSEDIRSRTAPELIKRVQHLNNGWTVVILKNNLAQFFFPGRRPFFFGNVRRVFNAADGKFTIAQNDGGSALFSKDGEQLCPFGAKALLFSNGCYRLEGETGFSLFAADGKCIGTGLKNAEVFKDGKYYIACHGNGDGSCTPGLYDADNKRIAILNDGYFKMLRNGWFIAGNELYDNLGVERCTGGNSRFDRTILLCIGFFMAKA